MAKLDPRKLVRPDDGIYVRRDRLKGIGYAVVLFALLIAGINGAAASSYVGVLDLVLAALVGVIIFVAIGVNLFHRSHTWCPRCKGEINTTWTFTGGRWNGGHVVCRNKTCGITLVRNGNTMDWVYPSERARTEREKAERESQQAIRR